MHVFVADEMPVAYYWDKADRESQIGFFNQQTGNQINDSWLW